MLKIKLSRQGKRGQPHYRIVVAEAKSKRDGKVTEKIGHYDPLSKPATIKIDLKKYKSWIEKGAKPTNTVKNLAERVKKS
ncbi:30S ribosomal protein S16 [Patescibacteria group bacterium]